MKFPKMDVPVLRKTAAVFVFLGALFVAGSFFEKILWLNMTGSVPVGLYRMEEFDGQLSRGDLVLMEVPPEFHQYVYGRHWLPEGWPLLKHVGALPGDTLCVTDTVFTINGKVIGPVYRQDNRGRPLPRLRTCLQIPPGRFLPVATGTKTSFDGRYMGPVATAAIRGIARPVIVFQGRADVDFGDVSIRLIHAGRVRTCRQSGNDSGNHTGGERW